MRKLVTKPIVFILIEDETALLQISNKYVYEIAVEQARQSGFLPEVKVFIPREIYDSNKIVFAGEYDFVVEESFKKHLSEYLQVGQIVVIHNASRPLVQKKIYDQGINLLLAGADAVKQQHVVVDTLKVVDTEKIIQTTVDRDLIKALTSPEFYWVESITSVSEDFGWFYKIKVNGKIEYIVGELESTRIRTERDLLLVNALIQQGRLN
jgi:2-C-methyl-D-erythritol 4-phosphate cytidylyltransferase